MIALLTLCLIGCGQCANIFVTSPFGGSHLHSIYDVAVVLADAGHNITFINLEQGALDSYTHPGITGYTVKHNAWKKGGMKNMMVPGLSDVIKQPSEDMMLNTVMHPGVIKAWKMAYEKSADLYSSDEIKNILDNVQFDLIIAEVADTKNIAVITKSRNIPIISFAPFNMIWDSIVHGNLPMLVSSQPSFIFSKDLDTPPSFASRFLGFLSGLRMIAFDILNTSFDDAVKMAYTPLLEKYGYNSFDEVKSSIKLFITNDHVAFSFPLLRPPNDIAIGGMTLLNTKQNSLPPNIVDFIDDGKNKPIIYISFGSYISVESCPWYDILISVIDKMDVKVIIKTEEKKNLGSGFLPLPWVPQKDLLSSGKVKFFISHCGNNGRVEAIFFNVPVLCIPLFIDQYINAELVKFKGFGEIMLKEDITDEKFVIDKVENMIKKHNVYYQNMKVASDIVKNEPGNVRKKLLFYINYLAKYKSLDFLQNEVIQKQSIIEIYNLDILIPFVAVIFLVAALFIYMFYRLGKCVVCRIYNRISPKQKEE